MTQGVVLKAFFFFIAPWKKTGSIWGKEKKIKLIL